ncbi:MAG: excinuclease ABC subunit UvrC, partial [Alphaproteobacteria bacterium]
MSNKKNVGVHVIIEKLKHISARSGVYRMISESGTVIYVGKAKNLKKRLTNYTHLDKLSLRIRQMVEQTADLIVIETAGETEALLLESDLIKQYRPYYNILLKDDKSFPFILITADEVPRLQKYRGAKNIRGAYFGPFPSGLAVNKTITEIQKVFGLRTCPDSYFAHRTRPCLLYQIGRCTGPCCACISPQEYAERVRQAHAFLKGERIQIQEDLILKMQELAAAERYEEAAVVRDKIQFLNQIQSVAPQGSIGETDVIALYTHGDTACIQVFFYRSEKASGNTFYLLPHIEDMTAGDILSHFLLQFYDVLPPAKNVLLSHAADAGIEAVLTQKHHKNIRLMTRPFKGIRKKMMEQALANAETTYHQQTAAEKTEHETWMELAHLLGRDTLDKVEIYDN